MFTHQVVPLHIESLLGFLYKYSARKLTREDLKRAFQPDSIADSQIQSTNTISAAIELELVELKPDKSISLAENYKRKGEPSVKLLNAIEKKVLVATDVEYLSLIHISEPTRPY